VEQPARENWREIIPERDDALAFAIMTNRRILVHSGGNTYRVHA
jgi:hypothetical protein